VRELRLPCEENAKLKRPVANLTLGKPILGETSEKQSGAAAQAQAHRVD
jgi:hypothetical protein